MYQQNTVLEIKCNGSMLIRYSGSGAVKEFVSSSTEGQESLIEAYKAEGKLM